MNAVSVLVTMSLLPVSLSQHNVLQRRWGHQMVYRLPYNSGIKSNTVKYHHTFDMCWQIFVKGSDRHSHRNPDVDTKKSSEVTRDAPRPLRRPLLQLRPRPTRPPLVLPFRWSSDHFYIHFKKSELFVTSGCSPEMSWTEGGGSSWSGHSPPSSKSEELGSFV